MSDHTGTFTTAKGNPGTIISCATGNTASSTVDWVVVNPNGRISAHATSVRRFIEKEGFDPRTII
jgi:hypothetical protein